jgi:hypothetical protein
MSNERNSEHTSNSFFSTKLILMGFFCFSPFGTTLIMDIFEIPISIPELLFIPFLFIFRKRYYFSNPGYVRLFIYLFLWIVIIIISLLANNYSLSAILGSARSYFTLIVAYLVFSKDNNVSLEDIMFISLGSTIGWLCSSIYGISSFLAGHSKSIAMTGNMLTIPLLISIAVLRKRNKIFLWAIILCLAISLTSGMRRQIVVFLCSLFLTYGFLSVRNIKRFLVQSFVLVVIVINFIFFLPPIEGYLKENIPILYYRIFEKSEMLLSGKGRISGDSYRTNNMTSLMENISDYIVPMGFVSRQTLKDENAGRFIDFPLMELFYMFGVFFALLILFFIGIYTIGCCYQSLVSRNDAIIFVILSFIMLMLLFLEGTFLSSSYVAPVTGYCLGRIKYHSRLTFFKDLKFNF